MISRKAGVIAVCIKRLVSIAALTVLLAGCESLTVTGDNVKDFAYGIGKVAYDTAKRAHEGLTLP